MKDLKKLSTNSLVRKLDQVENDYWDETDEDTSRRLYCELRDIELELNARWHRHELDTQLT